MSQELNTMLFRARPFTGEIEDFEILFMTSSSEELHAVDHAKESKTLLNDLPALAVYIDAYKQVANNGGSLIVDTINHSNGQKIHVRSTLFGNNRHVLELWEYVLDQHSPSAIEKNNKEPGFVKKAPGAVAKKKFIAEPIYNSTGDISDFRIQSLNKRASTGTTNNHGGYSLAEKFPEFSMHMDKLVRVVNTGMPELFTSKRIKKSGVTWLHVTCSKNGNNILIDEEVISEQEENTLKIRHLNKELDSKNRELKYLNSELRTLSSIAANDYKSALKKMYTALEFILIHDAASLSNEGKANLRRVQSGIQKLKLLTEDIVSFSSLEAVPEGKEWVDLNIYLEQVKNIVLGQVSGDITIESAGLEPIKGYPTMLYLLFYHLLDNAVKFRSKERNLHVRIECSRVNGLYINHADASPDTFYDLISIADNGIGFDQEFAGRIFTMFFRIEKTNIYKGSGIGLAFCRKIIQIHDGFITAEGTPDQGAVFNCYFPCEEVSQPGKTEN